MKTSGNNGKPDIQCGQTHHSVPSPKTSGDQRHRQVGGNLQFQLKPALNLKETFVQTSPKMRAGHLRLVAQQLSFCQTKLCTEIKSSVHGPTLCVRHSTEHDSEKKKPGDRP